ncbi:hypothetical protein OAQ27_01450 [Aquiluna sp.]|nr:hypothetical protein [Aquiluna sp.]
MNKTWISRLVPNTSTVIRKELKLLNFNSENPIEVLDIGGGRGSIWRQLEDDGWLEKNGIRIRVTILDPVDKPDEAYGNGSLTFTTFVGVAPKDLARLPASAFAIVTAFDVIEHLPKHEGYLLLYEMNRLSAVSIIRTPNGFIWQPPFRTNPFQAHISAWRPSELRRLGWKLTRGESGPRAMVGIGGLAKARLSHSKLRLSLAPLEEKIIFICSIFLYRFPGLSFEFCALRKDREFDLEAYVLD